MRLEELVPRVSCMLETVAPKASYVKMSGQIFQNRDLQLGGKSIYSLGENLCHLLLAQGVP